MDPVTRKLLDSLGDRLREDTLEDSGRLRLTAYGKDGTQIVTRTYKAHTEPVRE